MKKLKASLFAVVLVTLMVGCSSHSVPTQQSSSLPIITSLKTISDMTEVGFEWLPVNNENVIGYELYRKDNKTGKFKAVAQIKDRFTTHYVDSGLEPDTTYVYQLRTYSKEHISDSGESVSVMTRPLYASVPFIQAITGLPGRVKLIWRPHPDTSVVSYIIKRADVGSDKFSQIAHVKGRLNAEYIDTSVKHGKGYLYAVFVVNGSGVVSKSSEVVRAVTKELP